MEKRKNANPSCVVRENADSCLGRNKLNTDSQPEDCLVIEPIRKLLALGLSAEEIEHLDITQPMLQSICEYARLDDADRDTNEKALGAIKSTVSAIGNQIGNLDLEVEMLLLRKNALEHRRQVLGRLAATLRIGSTDMPITTGDVSNL